MKQDTEEIHLPLRGYPTPKEWEGFLYMKYNTIFKALKDLREELTLEDISDKQKESWIQFEEEILKALETHTKEEFSKNGLGTMLIETFLTKLRVYRMMRQSLLQRLEYTQPQQEK